MLNATPSCGYGSANTQDNQGVNTNKSTSGSGNSNNSTQSTENRGKAVGSSPMETNVHGKVKTLILIKYWD